MIGLSDLRKLFRYDAETGRLYWRRRTAGDSAPSLATWNTRYAGKEFGSINGSGYRTGKIYGRDHRAHRIIYALAHGYYPHEVDHIDGDKTNNRLTNLRDVSHAENCRNKAMSGINTSGHVGVYWHKTHKRWQAAMRVDQQLRHLGYFTNKRDAIAARAAASKEHFHPNHGRYAK